MYISFFSLDKCYSLGNFNVSEIGRLIKITSIEKQLLADETCKTFLKGKYKDDFNHYICTDFRLEEKVRNNLNLQILHKGNHE